VTRLLVSVRDSAEAGLAAAGGADFIDLKDPAAGALGGLPPERIEAVVRHLRAAHPGLPISATIGDWPVHPVEPVLARVRQVAACGVDYVKVGVAPGPLAPALLQALARCGVAVVPVLIADDGVDTALVAAALAAPAFPALMLDTEDKHAGSLLQRLARPALAQFVAAVRGSGRLAGLAGALRLGDVLALQALAPDFAGFRSAVCDGDRAGALVAQRVRELRGRLAARPHAAAVAAPW